jgi:cytochrome c1
MDDVAGLPSVRWSLRGLNEDGDEAWLIRGVSRKLYRCPGCHSEIEIGAEHTIVQYVMRLGGSEHHHWHRRCAEELLVPALRQVKRVPAAQSSQEKLEARGRRPSGKRRR